MKQRWKLLLIITLGIIATISICPELLNFHWKARSSYHQSVKFSIKEKSWISFDLIVEYRNNGQYLNEVPLFISYHYSKDDPEIFINYFDGMDFCRITRYKVDIISFHNNTITSSNSISSFLSLRNDMEAKLQYLPYYTYGLPLTMRCKQWEMSIIDHVDTIVNNKKCKLFIGHTKKRLLKNTSNGNYSIPIQYECCTWINADSHQVDSVVAYNITQNEFNQVITYRIDNLTYDDKSSFYDSIFDVKRPFYDDFSRENGLNVYKSGITLNELNNENLSFPIINTSGDTTSISEFQGWLLLDLWMFGCGGCDDCFKVFKREFDSLGYRLLEKEEIKIISVNALSSNMEMICDYANKYKMKDIMYSSKGFNAKLLLVNYAFPSYYLISPNKKIVWCSNYLGDYSELLEAKANYERKSNTKITKL